MTDPFRHDAAPYVLGALTPEERYAFERHREICSACDADVRDFAGLPGLLARISDQDVPIAGGELSDSHEPGGDGDAPAVPHLLLPALLGEVHRRRRTSRWRTMAARLAAACLAVLGGVVGLRGVTGASTGGSDGLAAARPTTSQTSSARPGASGSPSTSSVQRMEFRTVGDSPVEASAILQGKVWGTQIEIRCERYSGASEATVPTYTLVALDSSGSAHEIADWQAVNQAEIVMQAATSVSLKDLVELRILNAANDTVLDLKL